MDAQGSARLLDRAPAGVLSLDDDGILMYVNETLADMLGHAAGALPGQRIDEILSVSSRIFHQTHFVPLLRLRGEASEIYVTFRARSGETVHALVNAVRRPAEDGKPRTDCVVLRLREREKYEAELIMARKSAEESNRTKSQFLATFSHEVRTPLNAIGGYADLLSLGLHGAMNAEQAAAVERIRVSQQHLARVIGDILDFAQVDAGKLQLNLTDVPVDALLRDAETMVGPQLAAKRLRFHCAGVDPSLYARADRERFLQIIINLMGNAVKFTPEGGDVALECRADDESVMVCVRDTGVGIAPDKLHAVFQPFVQVERLPSNSHAGIGLGLTISRELAVAMRGTLGVTSAPGDGSTFTLSLPRAPSASVRGA